MKERNTHTTTTNSKPTMAQYHPQLKETHEGPLPSRKISQQPTTK